MLGQRFSLSNVASDSPVEAAAKGLGRVCNENLIRVDDVTKSPKLVE